MNSDDVINSVEIVEYCESYFLNMELLNFRCIEKNVVSMFTKHQKAETKMILIICKVLKFVFF